MSTVVESARCGACGAALEPGAAFCGTCGARVGAGAPAVPAGAPGAAVPAGAPGAAVPAGDPGLSVPAAATAPDAGWSLGADVDEAVAPVWRRLVALLVDQVLAVVVGGGATLAVLPALRDGSVGALLVPGLLLLLLGAGQWIAEAVGGRTVGSALLGIRTVSARTGRPAGLWAVLVRHVVQALGALVAGVGVYVVAGSGAWDEGPEQRGWHDKAAGTLVLRARPVRDAAAAERAAPDAAAPAAVPGRVVPERAVPERAVPERAVPERAVPERAVPERAVPEPAAVAGEPVPTRPVPTGPVPTGPVPTGPVPTGVAAPPAGTDAPPAAAPVRDAPDDLPDSTIPTVPGLGELEHTHVGRWAAGPEAAGPATVLALVLDTGERVVLSGPGLVGRRPVAGAETWAHLVTIDDPEQSVSSTHLAFWPADSGLDVLDRGSTNGTVLLDPAGKPWSLPPGRPARVAAGWTLVLGRRRVTVEQA
ncbi:RDD family protein [Cellulomonas endometrii]|uniref:RDD family protein n=1 Tax=Cellulomonas endometrii TaxID=3036301 RepID=UPI0024ADEBAA|nr:RDD family protein [Cellulomonas endometrii]